MLKAEPARQKGRTWAKAALREFKMMYVPGFVGLSSPILLLSLFSGPSGSFYKQNDKYTGTPNTTRKQKISQNDFSTVSAEPMENPRHERGWNSVFPDVVLSPDAPSNLSSSVASSAFLFLRVVVQTARRQTPTPLRTPS
jgi:hypothetical protein